VNRERRAGLGDLAEPDHALARERRIVAADKYFFALARLHERTVRALVDQHEAIASCLDPGMNP